MLYWILAQTGGAGGLEFLDFVNLGVLAVLVVAFIKGWVVPAYVLEKSEKQLEAKDEELSELRKRLDSEVLPQLWRTTDLLAQFANKEKS